MKTNLPCQLQFGLLFLCSLIFPSCLTHQQQTSLGTIENQTQATTKPNIIYILADDLGYGDLSCYGQEKFQTPNIDKLAAQGMKFTQHYSGSAVCAPARSSLMTGQHTGHTPIRGNRELNGEGQLPLPAISITIAEVLKSAGYTTGAFGKWGLGFIDTEGDPLNQGFDEFYGYNCQRMAHRYYPPYLWHNRDTAKLIGNDWTNTVTYAPNEIQAARLNFIDKNKDKPFFAYMPIVMPHAELIVPEDEIIQQFRGKFKERPHPVSKRYTSDYGLDIVLKEYCSQDEPYATYAAMITLLDNFVGQIVDKLETLGIADNTIILIASDNGPHTEGGANPKFFNSTGGLRGVKRDLYEGGIRSPLIAYWPNKIKANTTSDHISAFWDMLPTFADLAGVPIPNTTDGISILPTLIGEGTQTKHSYLYWEFNAKGGRQAVRLGKWKGVIYNLKKNKERVMELYNLEEDERETQDIAKENPAIVQQIREIMAAANEPSTLFPLP